MQGITVTQKKIIKKKRSWFTVRSLRLIFSSLYWCRSIDLVIPFLLWWKQRDSMYLKCRTHQWIQELSLQYRIIWDLSAGNGTVFIHQRYKSTFHTCSSGSQIQSTYKADFRYALAFASDTLKIDFFLFIKKHLKKKKKIQFLTI